MAKNSNIIGIAAVLLILASRNDSDKASLPGKSSGGLLGILPSIEIGGILKDLHKLTFIMNHMDNLGQMALNPSERPKLPAPSEMISRAIPDLGNIMEVVAPLISAMGGDSNGENENALF